MVISVRTKGTTRTAAIPSSTLASLCISLRGIRRCHRAWCRATEPFWRRRRRVCRLVKIEKLGILGSFHGDVHQQGFVGAPEQRITGTVLVQWQLAQGIGIA